MVEMKEKFSVKKNYNGQLVLTAVTTTTFSDYEASVQLQKIQEQIVVNINKESLLDKQIKNKVFEKERDRCNKKVHMLRNLGEKINKLIEGNTQGHD